MRRDKQLRYGKRENGGTGKEIEKEREMRRNWPLVSLKEGRKGEKKKLNKRRERDD